MLEWLKSLPKTTFVALVLTVGVLYIVLSDPPKNICDAQLDQFNKVSLGLLSLNPKQPSRKVTHFQELFEICKTTKSPGGCYELFASVKQIIKNTHAVAPECNSKLAGHAAFGSAVWSTLDLMARLAWGEHPPSLPGQKQGWLDPADLNLYCSLKNISVNIFGKERFDSFQEGYFQSLPEAARMARNDAWSRMLFSVNCAGFQ